MTVIDIFCCFVERSKGLIKHNLTGSVGENLKFDLFVVVNGEMGGKNMEVSLDQNWIEKKSPKRIEAHLQAESGKG